MYDTSTLLLLAAALAVGTLIGMAITALRRRAAPYVKEEPYDRSL